MPRRDIAVFETFDGQAVPGLESLYQVTTQNLPITQQSVGVVEVESNDSLTTAQFVPLGLDAGEFDNVVITGSLESGTDVDIFTFNARQGDVLFSTIDLIDANLTLFDLGADGIPGGGDDQQLVTTVDPSDRFLELTITGLTGISLANPQLAPLGTETRISGDRMYALQIEPGQPGDYVLDLQVAKPLTETLDVVQEIFLDFDGASGLDFSNAGQPSLSIPPLDMAAMGFSPAQEDEFIDLVVDFVTTDFERVRTADINNPRYDFSILTSRDDPDPAGSLNTMRVAIGGTAADAGLFFGIIGLADDIDTGNQSLTNNVLVFPEDIAFFNPTGDLTIVAQEVADVVSHEIGHGIGLWHTDPSTPGEIIDPFSQPPGTLTRFSVDSYRGTEVFAGVEDVIGAVAFNLTGPMPPVVVDVQFEELNAIVTLNEPVTNVNASTFLLERSGLDGIFGDGNEVAFNPVSITSDISETIWTFVADPTASLLPDTYRITLSDSILDTQGNSLDGEFTGQFPSGNGNVGGDFVFTLDVTDRPPRIFIELEDASDTGVKGDRITNRATPTLEGIILDAFPSLTRNQPVGVRVDVDADFAGALGDADFSIGGVTTDNNSEFQFDIPAGNPLPEGVHRIELTFTDLGGNTTVMSRAIRVDLTAPSVTAANIDGLDIIPIGPLPLLGDFSQITVVIDDPPIVGVNLGLDQASAALPSNYQLLASGNGLFGDGDDLNLSNAITLIDVAFDPLAGSETTITLSVDASLLVDDLYQFIVKGTSTVTDTAGNAIDGDNNGTAGPDFIREFLVDTTAPRVLDINPNPRSIFDTSSAPDEFVITFTEDVVGVDPGMVVMTRSNDGLFSNGDDVAIPGTLAFAPGRADQIIFTPDGSALPLEPDYYRIRVLSNLTADTADNQLDGEPLGFDDGIGGFEIHLTDGRRLPGLSGDGLAGGDYVSSFIVAAPGNILFVQADYDDDPLLPIDDPDGTLTKPFPTLQRAMGSDPAFTEPNSVASLRAAGATGPIVVWALESFDSSTPLVISSPKSSGIDATLEVPDWTALIFDPGTITKLQNANIDVSGAGAVLQINGSPLEPSRFTAFADDTIGGDTNGDGNLTAPFSGDWGGLVLRDGSDDLLSVINFAQIRYGGGPVPATLGDRFDPIFLEAARPAVTNTLVSFARSAQAAISANVDSFHDNDLARGPLLRDITFLDNSINGIWVRPEDPIGIAMPTEALPLTSAFTFDDPVPHVFTSILVVGQRFLPSVDTTLGGENREVALNRVNVDPGVVLKFRAGAGIETSAGATLNIGDRRFLDTYDFDDSDGDTGPRFAPLAGNSRVILTSLFDDNAETGTDVDNDGLLDLVYTPTGDTNNDLNTTLPSAASWGGIGVRVGTGFIIDEADLRFGGGENFQAEGSQLTGGICIGADCEFVDGGNVGRSVIEIGPGFNGLSTTPIFTSITNNNFFSNAQAGISIKPNQLRAGDPTDPLESGNPFIRGNVFENNDINGMEIRTNVFSIIGTAANDLINLRVNGLWDDTDIVHVVQNFPVIATGDVFFSLNDEDEVILAGPVLSTEPAPSQTLTLQSLAPGTVLAHFERISGPGESLVVKFLGSGAAPGAADKVGGIGAGFQFGFDDGDDAVGDGQLGPIDQGRNTQLRILGIPGNEFLRQPPVPVVLTSLLDDSAGTTVRDVAMFDTNSDGENTTPAAGDGGIIMFGAGTLTDYDLFDLSRGNLIHTAEIRYMTRIEVQGGSLQDIFDLRGPFDDTTNTFDPPDEEITRDDLLIMGGTQWDQRRGTGINSTQAMMIASSVISNMRDLGVQVTTPLRPLIRNTGPGTTGENINVVSRNNSMVAVPAEVFLVNNIFTDNPIGVQINGDTDTGGSDDTVTGFPVNADALSVIGNTFVPFDMRNHSVLLHNTFNANGTAVQVLDPSQGELPAQPLLMNNIFANSTIQGVDHQSPDTDLTFVGDLTQESSVQFNLYFNNAADGFVGENALFGDPMFLDPANGNFRLGAGSAAVDASLSELGPGLHGDFLAPVFIDGGLIGTLGRSGILLSLQPLGQGNEFVALPDKSFVPLGLVDPNTSPANGSLNIPDNPNFDPTQVIGVLIFGDLGPNETGGQQDMLGFQRVDEPGEPNIGFGRRPFFDFGALERSDFTGPTIDLTVPLDNGPDDRNPAINEALVNASASPSLFELTFTDFGYGVDDTTVSAGAFTVQRDGAVLSDGVDFFFNYDAANDVAQFFAFRGIFPGGIYRITVDNTLTTGVLDQAGNPVVGNNVFTIVVDADPPVAVIRTPDDNGSEDFDPAVDVVVVTSPTGEIVIELTDMVGEVDDDSVAELFTPNVPVFDLSFQVDRGFGAGDETLVLDTDFSFSYDLETNEITLTPLAPLGSLFDNGLYTITLGDGAPGGLEDISDEAGNLLANPILIVHVREAGVIVTDTSLTVMEQGPTSDQYDVFLTSQPTDDVTISLSVDDPTEVTLSTTSLLFTSANWFIPQTVTVTAVDDNLLEPLVVTVVISQTSTSADLRYDGIVVADVAVDVIDNEPPATISGVKFNDLDLDGQQDPGEPGLAGWTIFLDQNNNGTRDPGEDFDVTDAGGNYSFSITEPDVYRVAEVQQDGWLQTAPPSGVHVLPITTSVNLTGIDFGNFLTSTISGRKFEDLNLDGVQGPGEFGLAGWVIFLDQNGNNVLDGGEVSTVTDAAGDYTFEGLTLGTFRVVEVNQAGWVQTAPASGVHVVNLNSSGQTITGRDFGNFQAVLAGPEILVNQVTVDAQLFPSIAMAPDGRFVIAWASRSAASDFDIFVRQYNADGTPAGNAMVVNTFLPGTQTLPSVAIDESGDFVVTWTSLNQDGSPRSVYAQRFDSTGAKQGAEFRVNLLPIGFQTNSVVAMDDDGDFTIVWTDFSMLSVASDLFAQRFDASGVRQDDPFKVNTFTTVGQGADSDVTMDPDGNIGITWTSFTQDGSDGGVFTRLFGADGSPVGTEFQVNTFVTGKQTQPSIAMDPGGNFTIVWTSRDQDGDGLGVFGRQFNAAGAPLDDPFLVNTFTTGDQRDPDVTMDAHGGFVVTWTSVQQDGDRDGVFAQRYDAAGNQLSGPLGVEFQVNTTTFNHQNDSVIASNPAGNFAIAWASFGQDGSAQAIVARLFQNLAPAMAEITVIAEDLSKIVDGTTAPLVFPDGVQSQAGPTLTFTVRNDGLAPLNLGGVALPAGFTLVNGLPAVLAPGSSDALTIQLNTASLGTFSGQVVISSTDADENPYNFEISGTVLDATIAAGAMGATPGLFDASRSTFFLKNDMQPGAADEIVNFGAAGAGWTPLAGDWNNDQIDTTAVFDPTTNTFYLNDSGLSAAATSGIRFGPQNSGWTPLVGDWDGNGTDTIGLFDPVKGIFYLNNSNTPGVADLSVRFGPAGAGWTPIVGDWDGDGIDTIGLHRSSDSTFFLKNTNSAGAGDSVFRFGPRNVGWMPITGDWDNDGQDTVGLHDLATSTFYLKEENSPGVADHIVRFGPAGLGWTPLVGDWDGSAAASAQSATASLGNPFAFTADTITTSASQSSTKEQADPLAASLPQAGASRFGGGDSQVVVGADQTSSSSDSPVDTALSDLEFDSLDDALLDELAVSVVEDSMG